MTAGIVELRDNLFWLFACLLDFSYLSTSNYAQGLVLTKQGLYCELDLTSAFTFYSNRESHYATQANLKLCNPSKLQHGILLPQPPEQLGF